MTAGIDKLVEFLISCIRVFQFWTVVQVYERGVLLRLGNLRKELGPTTGLFGSGFHLVFPFYVDKVLTDNVVPRTHTLTAQALTTQDGKTVSVTAVVTANIRDIKKALLEVEGVDHALVDACAAAVGAHVAAFPWEQLRGEPAADALTKACRKGAWRYGIEIERVQLADLALCRVIRLHTSAKADITGFPN